MIKKESVKVLGIDFFNGHVSSVVGLLESGGLLVAPSGPGLETIERDQTYYRSLLEADIVIPDSGYMVLIWNLLHRTRLNRISGLLFLDTLFKDQKFKTNTEILLVNPRPVEAAANLKYMNGIGFNLTDQNSYLAPLYPLEKVEDSILLSIIKQRRPQYIIINIGGGIQEKLGAYIKRNLDYRPAIICTGAAIAFFSGHQAHIPSWADRLFLGWLIRCIQNPKLYVPRYVKSFRLLLLMLRYGSRSPYL